MEKKSLLGIMFLLFSISIPIVSAFVYQQQAQSISQVIINTPYFYVDNNTSDMDSIPDKGTHSNFTAQQSAPNSIYDTLTEENTGNQREIIEDYVDNNNSDMDISGDVGSHSDFIKQKAYDSDYDVLTESGDGSSGIWGKTDIGDATETTSSHSRAMGGISPSIDDMKIMNISIYLGATGDVRLAIYAGGSASDPSSATLLWDAGIVDSGGITGWYSISYGGDGLDWPKDTFTWITWKRNTGAGVYYEIGTPSVGSSISGDFQGERGRNDNIFNQDPSNAYTNNDPYGDSGTFGNYWYYLSIGYEVDSDYQLDLEVQFTDVIDFLETETLCIRAGTLGDEDLNVNYWNGSDWSIIDSDLTANAWNNYTISLTSTTYTIQFQGGTETSDAVEDTWQIDAVQLRIEGTGSKEDAVDNDASDVDSSADLGDLSSFDNMKATDSSYAILSESALGGDITYISEAEASATSGTSAQISKPTNTIENDFMIALLVSTISSDTDGSTMSSTPSGWTNEYDYTQSATSGQHVYIYWKIASSSEPSSYTWTWTSSCGWVAQITTFKGVDTGSPIQVEGGVNQESSSSPMSPSITTTEDNSMIWLYDVSDDDDVPASGGAPSGTTWTDQTEISTPGNGIGISTAYFVQASVSATGDKDWTLDASEENSGQQYALKPASSDYRLDQEVQWTDVSYSLPNENLSIYGGTMGVEDIKVDIWNGTGWETVFSDLSVGWNNVSITDWLTTSNLTIRFKGGTEIDDSSQDTWQIDIASLHVWRDAGENYELDLEVQWTNVDYSEANEELCIYGGTMSAEDIMVDVWNGTGWENVFTNLINGWNNVTVSSYLTSSTFTVRFKGSTETIDTTQDNWDIDATLLHTWS